MRSFHWILVLFFLQANASAPMKGMLEDVDGNELLVSWSPSNFESRPKALIWMDSQSVEAVFPRGKENQAKINRKGRGSLPTKLLVIPASSKMKPQLIDVPLSQTRLDISFQQISKNEIWLVGETPEGLCGGPISLGFYTNNSKRYQIVRGYFAIQLEKSEVKEGFPFALTSQNYEAIESIEPKFLRLTQIARQHQLSCRKYTGHMCESVFEIPPSFGGQHLDLKINFKISGLKSRDCPV